ncbi:MAG: ABC transporter substrate-binding protein [Bacteroidales bacterium]|jgi:iron complex transport system substrate-binding protein|nr:ABC transporter substrate-binding protein [Bacteroidales bacterium]
MTNRHSGNDIIVANTELFKIVNGIKKTVFMLMITALLFGCCGSARKTESGSINMSANEITVAQGFAISHSEEFVKITVKNPWQGASNISYDHYLVPKGLPVPEGIDQSEVIFVPVEKIVCMSTTHAGMISALGEASTIRGISGANLAYSPEIAVMVEKRHIVEVGYEANLNMETLIDISPDIVMMYGIGNEAAGHINKMKETGIKTMFNADYLEEDPLGKAEWIKLFGELYCKRCMADSIFSAAADSYNSLKSFIDSAANHHPLILLGLPFRDTWFVSPGNSFIAKLIADAGGKYLWNDIHSNSSMPLSLESVYIKAVNADYWLNTGTAEHASEIAVLDKRLGTLKSFSSGNLYNNNSRVNKNGGNDFWESGAISPHIILKDIASILHPELFMGYTPYYYRKLE